ncbi:MAG: hypothetical protein Q9218_006732 [Villophora microphyllina]
MATTKPPDLVKTRFLIVSDTHGTKFPIPSYFADVAIHCGDLTQHSTLEEFRTTIQLLKDIQAPLKLVIAGNHDYTLDLPMFNRNVVQANTFLKPEHVKKVYGDCGEARRFFTEAEAVGIRDLDEGTHKFNLENGAVMKVYASPWTPSLDDKGFRYRPIGRRHYFHIEEGTDVVITHGPPRGIMDRSPHKGRSGCPSLFESVFRARPRLHCFGHVHEGWGAKIVTWGNKVTPESHYFSTEVFSSMAAIDYSVSTIDDLQGMKPHIFDTLAEEKVKEKKADYCQQERCYETSHCAGDSRPLIYHTQTLFVNAAIKGDQLQLPWLVDIEVPKADA